MFVYQKICNKYLNGYIEQYEKYQPPSPKWGEASSTWALFAIYDVLIPPCWVTQFPKESSSLTSQPPKSQDSACVNQGKTPHLSPFPDDKVSGNRSREFLIILCGIHQGLPMFLSFRNPHVVTGLPLPFFAINNSWVSKVHSAWCPLGLWAENVIMLNTPTTALPALWPRAGRAAAKTSRLLGDLT